MRGKSPGQGKHSGPTSCRWKDASAPGRNTRDKRHNRTQGTAMQLNVGPLLSRSKPLLLLANWLSNYSLASDDLQFAPVRSEGKPAVGVAGLVGAVLGDCGDALAATACAMAGC
jgi:hypothetical protein